MGSWLVSAQELYNLLFCFPFLETPLSSPCPSELSRGDLGRRIKDSISLRGTILYPFPKKRELQMFLGWEFLAIPTTMVGHELVLIPAGEGLELLQARLSDFLLWQYLLSVAAWHLSSSLSS